MCRQPDLKTASAARWTGDHYACRTLASKVLKELGYPVLTATHRSDAMYRLAALGFDVDLVITDLMMLRVGWLELARPLADRAPDVKLLLISGSHDEDGPQPYPILRKPFDKDSLAQAVRSALDFAPTKGSAIND